MVNLCLKSYFSHHSGRCGTLAGFSTANPNHVSLIQAKHMELEMARLEHAKLLAKIQKKKEENRVIKVEGPPPPPPGSSSDIGDLPQLL